MSIEKPLAAFVFDAYGTLFDVLSITTLAERAGNSPERERTVGPRSEPPS